MSQLMIICSKTCIYSITCYKLKKKINVFHSKTRKKHLQNVGIIDKWVFHGETEVQINASREC